MTDDQLDAIFTALGDRTRRAILARLAQEHATVGELTALFTISQPAVSRHLKVMEAAGLISRSRQGTIRLSHLEAQPLKEAAGWLADYRTFWSESYSRLDELLSSINAENDTDDEKS